MVGPSCELIANEESRVLKIVFFLIFFNSCTISRDIFFFFF